MIATQIESIQQVCGVLRWVCSTNDIRTLVASIDIRGAASGFVLLITLTDGHSQSPCCLRGLVSPKVNNIFIWRQSASACVVLHITDLRLHLCVCGSVSRCGCGSYPESPKSRSRSVEISSYCRQVRFILWVPRVSTHPAYKLSDINTQ